MWDVVGSGIYRGLSERGRVANYGRVELERHRETGVIRIRAGEDDDVDEDGEDDLQNIEDFVPIPGLSPEVLEDVRRRLRGDAEPL